MERADRTIFTHSGTVRFDDTGGPGFPVLMVHGSCHSRRVFDRQLASPLLRRWRMIALDLPGHGESDDAADPEAYAIVRLAECLGTVAATLGLGRFAVLGWSMGGHIAIEMMSRTPGMAGLMLCGAPPVARGVIGMLRGFLPSFDLLLATKQHFSDRDAERFESLSFGQSAHASFRKTILRADGRARKMFSQSMLRGDGVDQRQAVEQAAIPISLIHGSEDPFVRLSYLQGLAIAGLFDGAVEVMHGVGHAPFWERPELFNPLFDRFLESVVIHEAENQARKRRAF